MSRCYRMAALSAVVTGALVAAGCGATTNEEGLGTGKDTPAATNPKPTTEIKGYGDAIRAQEQARNQQWKNLIEVTTSHSRSLFSEDAFHSDQLD